MTNIQYEIYSENCLNEEGIRDFKDHLDKLLDNSAYLLKVEPMEVENLTHISDSDPEEHSFILQWIIPATESVTTWVLLDYITKEMNKYNLTITSLNIQSVQEPNLECVI